MKTSFLTLEHKISLIKAGHSVVMSDSEMDHLDLYCDTLDYVSVPNENQVGTKDRWKVYLKTLDSLENSY